MTWTMSPSSYVYPYNVAVGDCSTVYAIFIITNNEGAQAPINLTLSTNKQDFVINGSTTQIVLPGTYIYVPIQFCPLSPGSITGTFTATCTAGDCNPTSLSANLTGYGIIPQCETHSTQAACEGAGCYWYNGSCHTNTPSCTTLNNSTDCVAYGCYWYNNSCHSEAWTMSPSMFVYPYAVSIGDCSSVYAIFVITNYGAGPINLTLSVDNTDFIIDVSATQIVLPGTYIYVPILFCPSVAGTRAGNFIVTCTAGDCNPTSLSASLTGYGVITQCQTHQTQSECESHSCYWYNGSCHTNPPSTCESINNQIECEANGCYWYQRFFWEPAKCNDKEQDLMDYFPLIAAGLVIVGATIIVIGVKKGG